MTWLCENWAAEQPVKPCGAKFCLFMLANWSTAEGVCWGSQERMMRATSQSERTVIDHLAALEAAGYIRRYERRGKHGQRLSDGYLLDPDDKFGLEKQYLKEKRDIQLPGKPKVRNSQVGEKAPTCEKPQNQPAKSAGISKEDSHCSPIKKEARACDPAAPGGGDAHAPSNQQSKERPPPYNTLWKEREATLIAAMGPRDWELWGANLVPLDPSRDERLKGRHDPAAYYLAAHAHYVAEHVEAAFGERLGEALGRPVRLVYRFFVQQARKDCLAVAEGPEAPGDDVKAFWRCREAAMRAAVDHHFASHYMTALHPVGFDGETVMLEAEAIYYEIVMKRAKHDMQQLANVCGQKVSLRERASG